MGKIMSSNRKYLWDSRKQFFSYVFYMEVTQQIEKNSHDLSDRIITVILD